MIRKRYRQAYTLVEIVSVMGVASLLLMTGSRVLQLSYKSHREALGHLTEIETLNQITHRIRNDADRAVATSAGDQIELGSRARRVRYVQEGDFLVRTWSSNTSTQNAPRTLPDREFPGQQRWRLPEGARVTWEIDSSQQRRSLRWAIRFPDRQRVGFAWRFLLGSGDPAGQSDANQPEPKEQAIE